MPLKFKRNITLLIRFNKIFLTHLYCELCVAYQEEYLCEYDDDNLPSFDDDKLKLLIVSVHLKIIIIF